VFLLVPYGHTAITTRIPWANYSLIAVNVLVFIWEIVGEGAERFILDPDSQAAYQLITHAFLHADLFHLFGNMLFLWVFGNAVNDRLGHGKYLICYFSFVALAGLGYLIVDGRAPMLGASGAICGIVGMFFILLAGVEVKMVFSLFLILWKRFTIGAFWMIGFWVLCDMAWMILFSAYSAVAYSAHVAGYIAGLGLATVLVKSKVVDTTDDDLFHLTHMQRTRPGPTGAEILSMQADPTRRVQAPLYDPLVKKPPEAPPR
jgi:membrane associated rhomboid family serine protease